MGKYYLKLTLSSFILLVTLGILYLLKSDLVPLLHIARATTYINTPGAKDTDTCNKIKISINDSPTCPRLTQDIGNSCSVLNPEKTNNVSSYTLSLNIESNDGNAHNITYLGITNFCNQGNLETDSTYCTCINNEESTGNVNLAIPANGSQTITLRRSSPYGIACGSYQFDFGILSVDNDLSCNLRHANGEFVGASSGCETGITCSVPTISGNVFIDTNKNGIKDPEENNYQETPMITTNRGTISTAPDGTYVIHDIPAGDVTLTYTSLPQGYTLISPLNGPPPSLQVKVGPSCDTAGIAGASCMNGNVINLNFAITDSIPWIQGYSMDMRFENGLTNIIPQSPAYPKYTLMTNLSATNPGIIFLGNSTATFGKGQASEENWVVGSSIYPEVSLETTITTSYQSLLTRIGQTGISPINMTTLPSCTNLSNCTLPTNLPSGAYLANENLNLNQYTFPTNSNYLFLINGSLTLLGNIVVPNTSTALFSAKQDITISKTVGAQTNMSPLPPAQIQGIYSANRDIILEGENNCLINKDKMLNVAGAFILNAGRINGNLKNQRDLCEDNPTIPSFTISPRLDFLLNAPSFLMKQQTNYREDIP